MLLAWQAHPPRRGLASVAPALSAASSTSSPPPVAVRPCHPSWLIPAARRGSSPSSAVPRPGRLRLRPSSIVPRPIVSASSRRPSPGARRLRCQACAVSAVLACLLGSSHASRSPLLVSLPFHSSARQSRIRFFTNTLVSCWIGLSASLSAVVVILSALSNPAEFLSHGGNIFSFLQSSVVGCIVHLHHVAA